MYKLLLKLLLNYLCLRIIPAILILGTFLFGCSKSSDVEIEITATPAIAARGQSLVVTVRTDHALDAGMPTIDIEPRDGLAVDNIQKVLPRQVNFRITVSPTSPVGYRILSLKAGNTHGKTVLEISEAAPGTDMGTDTSTDTGVFGSDSMTTTPDTETGTDSDSNLPQPTVEIRPATIFTGEEREISVFGKNTHFSASTEVTFPAGSGLVVTETAFLGATLTDGEHLALTILADANATLGNIIGTVSSPFGADTEKVYFPIEVKPAAEMVVFPASGSVGDTMTVSLRGSGTHFQSDAPATLVLVEPASQGVSIDLDTIHGPTDITSTIYIAENATPGTYQVIATTTLGVESERVSATFVVTPEVGDTDSLGQDTTDYETDETTGCNDFEVTPQWIPIGRYGKGIRFDAPRDITWRSDDRTVELIGGDSHFYIGDPNATIEENCYVSTGQVISCTVTAGLMATPGDYEIHITSGGVSSCGTLTVVDDDVEPIEIPTEYLPTYNMVTGSLDVDSNPSDYFAFSVDAGTTAVFHAYSLDRTTMDPVLRLIDASGDSWSLFRDDETPLGVDARMVYHFTEAGDYFMEVGPKLSDNEGDYQLYTYLLTHGNLSFEVEDDNDTFETAQTLTNPVGRVVHATADTVDDVDYYYFETTGPTTIHVVARRLGQQVGFADTRITLYDDAQLELNSNAAWYEVPSTHDPRLFVEDAGAYYLKVEAMEETSGFYALNIRPYMVINEINNAREHSWVEIQGMYNLDLAGYELCTFDGDGAAVDSTAPCADLSGIVTDADGYVAIYPDDIENDTLLLPNGPGAVSLLYQGSVMDKVQYGEIGNDVLAEGIPAEVGTTRAIGRAATVDSNNNKLDFVYMATSSPGMPNDRTYQSAIPLYGEPAD